MFTRNKVELEKQAFQQVYIQSFKEEYEKCNILSSEELLPLLERKSDEAWEELQHDPNCHILFKYEIQDGIEQLAGFLTFCLESHGQEIYLSHAATHSHFKRKGVFTQLFSSLLHDYPQIKSLYLFTRRKNVPACAVYTRLGFTISESRPRKLSYESNDYVCFEYKNQE